ncbi:efflux RND transporter periplasmic adaptor subunit [Gayadomonas joobiniege]|uniref:efflux RND transporter periplasmic adaptor subunit n=1 Tax=Gayadomonas joobiniege TaxID=1234606 RepID=UPI0003650596|nr:efflux RND transporter periplasmic adaptor subunit [Gayadomonas joobiniege]
MKQTTLFFLATLFFSQFTMAEQKASPVFAVTASTQEFYDQIEALGTLRANESVELTSVVTERVVAIHFESGQRVNQGDVLVTMETRQEEALLAEEKSVLAEAERQLNRISPLVKRGAATESSLTEAQLNIQTAKARITAIESQLKDRQIVAPFSGKLGLRNISVGIMAQPGTVITTLDDDSVMKLDFSIPEIYLSAIKEGNQIQASAAAYPMQTFSGVVQSIDSRVDTATRSIRVRVLLDNPDHILRPGMLMSVKLQKNPRQVIVLPEESLVPRGRKNYVYVVNDNNTAEFKPVKIGARKKGVVEIISGVQAGEQVVTHGTLKIQPGTQVKITAQDDGQTSLVNLLKQSQTLED